MPEIVNGLWIQGKLSALELLTIQSYSDNGFLFQLWTYSPSTINAPESTIIKDANEIIKFDNVFIYNKINIHGHGKGSYAGFSDIFRYKLLYEKGGIWTDMDITCLKPFQIKEEYIFRFHHKTNAVGNFMKCPKNSDIMKWCYELANKKVTPDNTNWMLPIEILNEGIQKYQLTKYIKNISNNDSFPDIVGLLTGNKIIPDNWLIIHWMNEEWRRFEINKEVAIKNSYYFYLLCKHNIPFYIPSFIKKFYYKLKLNSSLYITVTSLHILKFRLLKKLKQ